MNTNCEQTSVFRSDRVTLFDSQGNMIKCKCGKKPDYTISKKDSFVALCKDCQVKEAKLAMDEMVRGNQEMGFYD